MEQPAAHPYSQTGLKHQARTLPFLVIAFSFFAVNPFLFQLPFLGGRSLSLPLMLLIMFEMLSQREHPAKGSLQPWTILLFLINAGLLISFWSNILTSDLELALDSGLRIFFSYWYYFILIIIVIRLAMQPEYLRLIIITLGVGVIVLAGLRILEVLRTGGWGVAGVDIGGTSFITKNAYGILFSNFALFALLLPIMYTGPLRAAALAGVGIVVIAVLGTGSRGSWVGLGVGTAVFAILYAFSRDNNRTGLWFIAAAVIWLGAGGPLPATVERVVEYQSSTLNTLEEDESFAFRQVMNQKSRILIEKYPLFGVGLGQFQQTEVEGLIIPVALQGTTSEDFIRGSAHNSYLFLFAEAGLVTIIPYGLLLSLLAFEGGKTALALVRKGELWIIPVYASFASLSVHLWGLSGLGSTGPWLIYGLLAGIILKHRIIAPPPLALPSVNTARHVPPIMPEQPHAPSQH